MRILQLFGDETSETLSFLDDSNDADYRSGVSRKTSEQVEEEINADIKSGACNGKSHRAPGEESSSKLLERSSRRRIAPSIFESLSLPKKRIRSSNKNKEEPQASKVATASDRRDCGVAKKARTKKIARKALSSMHMYSKNV